MFKGIHHIAIICSDFQSSKYFYHQVLGFKILAENYRKDSDSFKLDLALPDGTQIELFSFPNRPKRPSYPEAQGLRHLAFKVESIQEVVSYLQSKGVETEPVRIDEYTGKQFTFFADPDDLPLEIYQE